MNRIPYNKDLRPLARELRKNMTDAEWHLWNRIRRKQLNGLQFYRQKNIGNFIVDFYCPAAKLIIELDGSRHYTEEGKERDEMRDSFLAGLGFTVMKFSDREVFENTEGVTATDL